MDAALVVGILALIVALFVPFIQRPRLEIKESVWSPAEPLPWTFAVFQVRNKPLGGLLGRFLTREVAQGCEVKIDYFKWGTDERIFPTITGRWSRHNPPITWMQEPTGPVLPAITGAPRQAIGLGYSGVYDPTPSLDPPEHDIGASERGEEVAVAILTLVSGIEAYAWSKESYKYDDWKNPERSLEPGGNYRIDVRVRGSGIKEKKASFRLNFLSHDFNDFRLEKV